MIATSNQQALKHKPAFIDRRQCTSHRLNLLQIARPIETDAERLMFHTLYPQLTSSNGVNFTAMLGRYNDYAMASLRTSPRNYQLRMKARMHLTQYEHALKCQLNIVKSNILAVALQERIKQVSVPGPTPLAAVESVSTAVAPAAAPAMLPAAALAVAPGAAPVAAAPAPAVNALPAALVAAPAAAPKGFSYPCACCGCSQQQLAA